MKKLLSILILLLPVMAYSQATTGYHRIAQSLARGTGIQAVIVPNATVTVSNTATGAQATIFSDPGLSVPISPAVLTTSFTGNYDYYFALNTCVTETLSSPGQGAIVIPNICSNGGGGGTGRCTGAIGQLTAIGAGNLCVGTPADWNVTNAASYTSPNPWFFISPSTTTVPVVVRSAGGGFATPGWVSGATNPGFSSLFSCQIADFTVAHTGDTLIFYGAGLDGGSVVVADGTNTYSVVATEPSHGGAFIAVAANVTAGSYTIGSTGMAEVNQCWVEERTGVALTSPVDQVLISYTGGSAYPSIAGPITTTFANEVIVASSLGITNGVNPPAGYSANYSNPDAAQGDVFTASQVVSSVGTYSSTWLSSIGSTVANFTFIVSLKSAATTNQTADLLEYQDSNLDVLSGVNGVGQHFDPANSGLPTNTPDAGTYPWCFDTSDNTPCYWNGTSWVHVGSGSGGIGGTVSAPHIPKATASNTLGDSLLSDSGTQLTYTGVNGLALAGVSGVGASAGLTEGTEGCTPTSGIDCLWSNIATHRITQNPNNIGELIIPGVGTAITAGHLFAAASNGIDLIDGGVPGSCTNCLTTLPPGSNTAGTLQTAITAAAAGSTLILPASYTETPTSGITIAKALTLECQPGATITRGANGNLITITASNVVIRGCKFNGGGFTGDTILATSVSGIQVLGNTILNGNGVGVFFSSVTNSRIQNNSVQSNNADDIVVFDASNNDVISNNLIDNSQDSVFSKGVSIHSNSVPSIISNITVANNTFKNRFGFVIEVGPFNGYMPTSINITGNVATQLSSTHAGSGTSGNFGGYSIFADTSTTTGNSYTNESGQMAGLPGLEIFGQTHNASNNSITGAVATVYTTSSTFANNVIMQGNLTAVNGNNTGNPVIQQLSITGNVVNTSGVVPGNAWTASTALEQNYILKDTNGCLEKSVFRLSTSSNLTGSTQPTWPACTQAAAGTITHDNNIDWMNLGPPMLPQLAAGTAYPGIELLCNTSGLTCGDYLVQGNKIIDNTVSTDQGFQDFAISGTTQKSTVFEGNQFVGWTTCYSVGTGLSPVLWMNDETGCGATGGVASAAHTALPTTTPTLTGAGGVTISGTWPNQTVTGSGSGGLSGMTAGQVPIAATATTVTSSKALAGAGTGIVTGPTSATATDIPVYTSTTGGQVDSGVAIASLAPLASPTFTGIPAAPTATVGTNTTQVATTAFVIANAGSGSAGVTLHGQGAPAAGTPATMTHVQSSPANTTAIFGSNVTSGNLLACSEQGESFYNPTSIPTDTVGTIYRSVAFYQNTGIIANQIWIGRAGGTGANTVTTNNSGTSVVISCDEFTAGTALVDIIATPVIGSTTPSTSVTTQTAGEMLYGSFTLARTGGTPTFTAGSGFTLGVSFGGSIGLSQNAVASEYDLGVTQGSHAIAMSASGSTAVDTTFVGVALYASATGGCTNGNFYVNDANNQTWGPCISGAIAPSGALSLNGNDVQFAASPFTNPGLGNATTVDGIAVTGSLPGAGYSIISDSAVKASWHPSPISGGTPTAATYWTSSTTLGSLPFTWGGLATNPFNTTTGMSLNLTISSGQGLDVNAPSGAAGSLGVTVESPESLLMLTDTEPGSGDNTGGTIGFNTFNLQGTSGLTRAPVFFAKLGNGFNAILETYYANSSTNPVRNMNQGMDLGWTNNGSGGRGAIDTGISKDSAGVIDIGNGGHQDKTGTIQLGNITTTALTQQAASNTGGTCTISAGTSCTITLSHTYTSPVCIVTQQSATLTGGASGCTVSGTTVTITSAVLNSETWGALVFGNPN